MSGGDSRRESDSWDLDEDDLRGRLSRAVPDVDVPGDAWMKVHARARSRQRRRGAAVTGAASVVAAAVVAILVGTGLPGLALSTTGLVGPAGYPPSPSTATLRPSDPSFDYYRDGQSLASLLAAGPSAEERALLWEAENLLLRDCMQAGGSDWAWQPRTQMQERWQQEDQLEQGRLNGQAAAFGDVDVARRDGYGIDWERWQDTDPGTSGDSSTYGFPPDDDPEVASRLLMGDAAADGIDLETIDGTLTIPATGCDAETQKALYGDYPQWARSTNAVSILLAPANAYAMLRDNNPQLAAADVSWSGCMDEKGYPGLERQRDAWWMVWTQNQDKTPAAARLVEQEVAVADAECVIDTDYETAQDPAEAGLVEYLARDGDLRAYGALVESALPRAELIVDTETAPSSTTDETQPGTPGDAPVELIGITWQLVTATVDGDEIEIPDVAEITLVVDGDQIRGESACNGYGYWASWSADGGRMAVGGLVGTRIGCAPELVAAESSYRGALARVTAWAREGDRLRLTGDGVDLLFSPGA